MRRMSLCLPGYYGEMCSSAVPLVPVRGAGEQAWGVWGAGPPATWAFAIFLASDVLFLCLFPVGFGGFAFSQCVPGPERYPAAAVRLQPTWRHGPSGHGRRPGTGGAHCAWLPLGGPC